MAQKFARKHDDDAGDADTGDADADADADHGD